MEWTVTHIINKLNAWVLFTNVRLSLFVSGKWTWSKYFGNLLTVGERKIESFLSTQFIFFLFK